MENHCIIGNSTLLSKGLQLVLQNFEETQVTHFELNDVLATNLTEQKKIDYVWINVTMEIKQALNTCKLLQKNFPTSRTFIFCEHKDPLTIKDFLKAGASGYFLPQCNTKNIKTAIEESEDGKIYIDPKLRRFLTQNILDIVPPAKVLHSLTKREKEILLLIVDEYTTQEIANKLFISFCTVETHRLHLIQKMGVRNTAGLVREAVARNLYPVSMNSMIR